MNHQNHLLQDLEKEIQDLGLRIRGLITVSDRDRSFDAVPDAAQSLVLIGNAGSELWPFLEAAIDGDAHPLDRWTKTALDPLSERFGAAAVYPFQRPHLPFLSWAQRAEGLQPGPLGLFVHPDFGPWHAYRAAFLFSEKFAEEVTRRPPPCETCDEKPCLMACPVNAVSVDGVNVSSCKSWLGDNRTGACMTGGCRARSACPVGKEWEYQPAHAAFHMRAFAPA